MVELKARFESGQPSPEDLMALLVAAMADAYGRSESGFTELPSEAGYIFPDDRLLRMGQDGTRYADHREIIGVLDEAYPSFCPEFEHRSDAMRFWMAHLNLVRLHATDDLLSA